MNRIFDISTGIQVPDGTMVHTILDARRSQQDGVPLIEETSLAVGKIPARVTSLIHVHPLVTQLTYVLKGNLAIKMKDAQSLQPYELNLSAGETVATEPGTFFQLINNSSQICEVLYVVSPTFIFEMDTQGNVIYNDALVLDDSWKDLEKKNWQVYDKEFLSQFKQKREQSLKRLK